MPKYNEMNFNKPRYESALFYIILLFLLVPVWIDDYPGMVDFPQHVKQTASFLGMLNGNDLYNEHYEINWYTPYIVPNLISLGFAYLFSPIVSNKILVSIYIVSTPLLTQCLARAFNRPEEVKFLTLPFVYGFAFHWGFVPFLMSSAISSIWIWYYFTKDSDPGSKVNIILSFIVMYSHAVAWGVVVFIILADAIYSKTLKNKIARPYILLPLLPLFLWLLHVLSNEVSSTESHLIYYKSIFYKIFSFVGSNMMGNDWMYGTIKLLIVIISIFLFCSTNRHNDRHYFLASSLCLLFFIMPNTIASIAFFSDRLLIFLPVFFALSIHEIKSKGKFVTLLSLATIFSVSSILYQQHVFNREVRPLIDIISPNIDSGSRVVFFTNFNDKGSYKYEILPTPKLVWVAHNLVDSNHLVSEYSFAYVFPEMVRFKNVDETRHYIAKSRYKYPNIDWRMLNDLDYLLIRDCVLDKKVTKSIQQQSPFKPKVTAQCWHLYEK